MEFHCLLEILSSLCSVYIDLWFQVQLDYIFPWSFLYVCAKCYFVALVQYGKTFLDLCWLHRLSTYWQMLIFDYSSHVGPRCPFLPKMKNSLSILYVVVNIVRIFSHSKTEILFDRVCHLVKISKFQSPL